MAKGRGHDRKKEMRRSRAARQPSPVPTPALSSRATVVPRRGLDAARGAVSSAYRAWVSDYGRRQVQAVATRLDIAQGRRVPPDLFLLAPLTTRTVDAPDGASASIQMGLPLVATRAGSIAVAPDRLAIAVLRLPEADDSEALAMLGLSQAPTDLPRSELLFAMQLPGEGLRGTRPADALAWYLARAIEAGDVAMHAPALAEATGEVLALLRPGAAPRGTTRLDPAALDAYEGYGADADEQPVPPDISAPPARGGLAGLPAGAYLHDTGSSLAPLLADLRDYVIGLWPYEYFGLAGLTGMAPADGQGRAATLAALANLVRRLDDVLARTAESEEQALAAEGQPPAWIAEETARYREARQTLRELHTAQDLLPRLGPILFDLEISPDDYRPEGQGDEEEEDEENNL